MANKEHMAGLRADPNDPDDFDVSQTAIDQAHADRAARRAGRPAGSDKERITIRLDNDVLAKFRATGPGWQTRINEALRAALKC
jgi:uncharacterized protein (DUF4415 family)